MHRKLVGAFCAALFLAALPAQGGVNGAADQAAPQGVCIPVALPVGVDWFDSSATPPRFYWGGSGPVFSTDCFTYTSAVPVEVDLTDAFFGGDQFRLYVDGTPVGQTPLVPADDTLDTTDPVLAFVDPAYSHGRFYPLPAGTHQLEIEVITNPFNGGGAYIRALEAPALPPTQAIPTLGAAGLTALVVLLAGGAVLLLRRRKAA